MLTPQEKKHIKEILSQGLGINQNINLAYFLNAIDQTDERTKEILSKIERIEYNQRILDNKLDMIIRLIKG